MWIAPFVAMAALALFFFGRPATQLEATATHAPHVLALVSGAPLPAAWSGETSSTVAFDDGSHLELTPGTQLRSLGAQNDPKRVDLTLASGRATFDIRPGGPRAWMIEAGETRVRVLGTRFTVERTPAHVLVSVERGKVRVESARLAGGSRDLTAGEQVDVAEATTELREDARPEPPSPATLRPTDLPNSVERTGDPKSAMKPVPPAAALPKSDRMARADAARAAGDPNEALAILKTVVDDHEPNAPLAAFTMGKIHSETLGDATTGAEWFERAIRLGLPAGLDEDAHARVAECYGRAGRVDDAARAAAKYEAMFPSGRHLARVRRWKRE